MRCLPSDCWLAQCDLCSIFLLLFVVLCATVARLAANCSIVAPDLCAYVCTPIILSHADFSSFGYDAMFIAAPSLESHL